MNFGPEPKRNKSQMLIALANYWGSRFGGINSFNADLLLALGVTFQRHVRVICVVLDAEKADIEKAAKNHVELVTLDRPERTNFDGELLPYVVDALRKIDCRSGPETAWLGHDRITGGIAIRAAKEMGGRSALIHHMSYADYEAFAAGAQSAAAKEKIQQDLFSKADVLYAVGPLLHNALGDIVEKNVSMLIPGLSDISVLTPPKTFTAFLSGRINKDTHRIKQAHLGVAAFAHATFRANNESNLPAALKSENNPTLKVRGLSSGRTGPDGHSEAESELNEFAETYAKRVINLRALAFTTDRETLFNELRRSSVALMPSWHEGFGLVAWEAIAAGIPLILSKKSGVYHLLKQIDDGVNETLVYAIDVRGQVAEPFFQQEDLKKVSEAIINIASNPTDARNKAARLRETLFKQGYTWGDAARKLVEALGWKWEESQTTLPVPPAATQPLVSTLENLLDSPTPQWVPGRGLSDSQLLRAEEAVIPFDNEALPFFNEQVCWVESQEFPIALCLIVGSGGAGKTRLALQLCTHFREKGWWTGFLRDSKQFPTQFDAITVKLKSSAEPSLIVIDYAETRKQDLLSLLKPLVNSPPAKPMRILLLARGGGDWWDRLEGMDPQCETLFAGRATSGPFPVPPLHDNRSSRERAFQRALEIFATKIRKAKPEYVPDLSAEYYGQPLLVQMAALLALRDEQTQSAEGLTRSLVNHERRYWAHMLADSSTNATADQAAQLMALSTLAGGLQSVREVEAIWKDAECGTPLQLKVVFNQLKDFYPDKAGLQSLRPDLLGEALVTQVLLSSNGKVLLDSLLVKSDDRIRHQTWTVLARIVRYRADMIPLVQTALGSHYARNAKAAAEVCCQTPGLLSDLMERAYDGLPESLKLQVSQQLSPLLIEDILPLNGLALRLSETRLKQARKKTGERASQADRYTLAKALAATSTGLARCANSERALEIGAEAERLLQQLAEEAPEHFQADWATSLNNFANRLSENGRSEEALSMAKRALDILEGLAKAKPERFEHDWASLLGNYANRLSENGRSEEALSIAIQALDIQGGLAKAKPERFEHDWATSLNNYASILSENGRSEEALSVAMQALSILERLAKAKPERFEHDWATSLNNYASILNENGRSEEALSIAMQALSILERLAKAKPERFEHYWATSLNNYASILSENGNSKEALRITKQSSDILERLARVKPERFEPDWAASLSNHATHLSGDGRNEEALIAIRRANEVYERLTSRDVKKFGYQYRNAILNEMFLHWLRGTNSVSNLLVESPGVTTSQDSKREWSGMVFHEYCIRACLATDLGERFKHAKQAIVAWVEGDATVRKQYEQSFFLVAAILDAAPPSETPVQDWRPQYEAMVKRRRGNIPAWFQTAAERLGLKLPDCSTAT